ncbi:unnamed protein product, partial [Prorocentrum cordatum]
QVRLKAAPARAFLAQVCPPGRAGGGVERCGEVVGSICNITRCSLQWRGEMWPLEKFKDNLGRAAQSATHASPAVVLLLGQLGPAHLGHVQMLRQAEARLARAGYEVLAGWLSPASSAQAPLAGHEPLSRAFRLRAAALACEGDELVDTALWEASLDRAAAPGDVVAALRASLSAEFQGASWVAMVRIFVVCPGDEVKQYQRSPPASCKASLWCQGWTTRSWRGQIRWSMPPIRRWTA